MYTIDPRGLVGMGDIDEQVDPQQWNEYVRKSQDSLRVIAEETGGIAVVNQNDFSKALKRIDAETSDYYVLGYYSKNPDATKRRRQVEVKVAQEGRVDVVPQGVRAQAASEAGVVVEEVGAVGQVRRGSGRVRYLPVLPDRPTVARVSPQAAFAIGFFFASRVRATASSRYASSISAPMKFTPSRAQATAVLPRPVNGSIAT